MADVHPDLEPLAWLVGRWEGVGALVVPGEPDRNVVSEVELASDGRPFLAYTARSWLLEADGRRGEPGPAESGFWRKGPEKFDVEVVLTDPDGAVAVLVGRVAFKKVELVSDLVARTTTATTAVTAVSRLYGGVESDLAYVLERATPDAPLQPYLSARLSPQVGEPTGAGGRE